MDSIIQSVLFAVAVAVLISLFSLAIAWLTRTDQHELRTELNELQDCVAVSAEQTEQQFASFEQNLSGVKSSIDILNGIRTTRDKP